MGSIVLTTLSIFLGIFFVFVGSLKVSQNINREMHREIRRNYVQYAKVIPFGSSLGLKVSPKTYRLAVGWIEIICGAVLVIIPGFLKQLANFCLLSLTLIAFYTHIVIDDKFERTAPSIVFTLMLSCRLIIYWQVTRREKTAEKLIPRTSSATQLSEKKED